MRKYCNFNSRIWFLATVLLCATSMWQLPRSFADEVFVASEKPNQFVELPALPKDDEKKTPAVLLDFDTLNANSDKWALDLVDPVKQFVMELADEEKSRWKIIRQADGNNSTVAQLAIRKGKLLFVWSKKDATDAIRRDLQRLTLRLLDSQNKNFLIPMAAPSPDKVVARHHGYDPSHQTPQAVIHEHQVPGLSTDGALKLRIQSPYSGNLSRRPYPVRRWLKHKWDFDNDDLKRLKVALQWMVERPRNKKNELEGAEPTVKVHQKITYDIGRLKDLPLDERQIKLHINNLQQSIKKDKIIHRDFGKQLKVLKRRARAIAGARRGTPEWAQITQVNNQINTTGQRMKRCFKRMESSDRDIKDLNTFKNDRLTGVLKQFEDIPYPYQVVQTEGDREIPVVESSTWGITADQCFPLLGSWKNDQGMKMVVSEHGITTTVDPDTPPIKQWFYKRDSVTPCSTHSNKISQYEQTKTNRVVCYFVEKATKGARTTVRREFSIAEDNPRVTHEKWYSVKPDVWVATAQLTYVSPSGAILHEEVGKRKDLKHSGKLTWYRMK